MDADGTFYTVHPTWIDPYPIRSDPLRPLCVPMMVDGNISGEGGIARCTPGGTAPPLRPSPHRPPGVTQKEGKIYPMKRYATLAMVTQPDKVLGWLCGLCRPTEKSR